jgi:hypothetical protein
LYKLRESFYFKQKKKNMKRSIVLALTFLMVGISGIGSVVLAHPGHTLHDRYSPGHYLSDPYHLSITIAISAIVLVLIWAGKKYLTRSRG